MSVGVYIENMEMPTKENAVILITPSGDVWMIGDMPNEDTHLIKTKAIPVPEPHGDLIDTEQLKETIDYYIREAGWNDEINKALSWVKDDFIDAEPTVIPASEEGET